MIHEIFPHKLDNQYKTLTPSESSKLLIIIDNQLVVKPNDNLSNSEDASGNSTKCFTYPLFSEFSDNLVSTTYAFSIDDNTYFLTQLDPAYSSQLVEKIRNNSSIYALYDRVALRDACPVYECLAGMTAFHLNNWYASVRFCGNCGNPNEHHPKLRAMKCPKCNTLFFPKISPAIIVAVTNNNKLLLTKYAGRSGANYALVAGFIEIGETAEECVKREVMEEVGINIKNIKYYDSQPWGYDGNLMLAYTAEADETKITLDKEELATAVWLSPEEIPETTDHSSLTREIIRRFKNGTL